MVHDWYPELQQIHEAQQNGTLHEWVQAQDPTRLASLFTKWLDLPPTPPAPLPLPPDQLNHAAAVAAHAAMVAAQESAAAAAAAAEAAAAGGRSWAAAAAAAGGEAGSSSVAAAGEHAVPQGLGSALRPPGPYLSSCLAKAASRLAPGAPAGQQGGPWQTASAVCLLPGAAEGPQLHFGSTGAPEATGSHCSTAATAVGTAPGAAEQATHVGRTHFCGASLAHPPGAASGAAAAAAGNVDQAKDVRQTAAVGAERAWQTPQGLSTVVGSSDLNLVTPQDTSLVTVVLMSAGLRAATLQRRQHMDSNAARMRQTGDRNQPNLSRETSALAMRAAFLVGFGMRAAAARGLGLLDSDQDVHMEEADGPMAAAGSSQHTAGAGSAAAAASASLPFAGNMPAGAGAAAGSAEARVTAVPGPFKSCLAAGKPTPNLVEHSSRHGVQKAISQGCAATRQVSADTVFEAAAVSLARIWAAYAAAEAAGAPCPKSVTEFEQFAHALGFPVPCPLPNCLRDAFADIGTTGRATQQNSSMAVSTAREDAAAAGTGSATAAGATQAAVGQAAASTGSAAADWAAKAAHNNPCTVPTIEEVQAMSDWETVEVRRLNAPEPLPPYLAHPTTPAGMIAASIYRAQHEAQQRTQEAAAARGYSPGSVAWHNAYAVRYSAMFGNMARKQMLPTADSLLDQFLAEHLCAMHLWMLRHQVGFSRLRCNMSLHMLGSRLRHHRVQYGVLWAMRPGARQTRQLVPVAAHPPGECLEQHL